MLLIDINPAQVQTHGIDSQVLVLLNSWNSSWTMSLPKRMKWRVQFKATLCARLKKESWLLKNLRKKHLYRLGLLNRLKSKLYPVLLNLSQKSLLFSMKKNLSRKKTLRSQCKWKMISSNVLRAVAENSTGKPWKNMLKPANWSLWVSANNSTLRPKESWLKSRWPSANSRKRSKRKKRAKTKHLKKPQITGKLYLKTLDLSSRPWRKTMLTRSRTRQRAEKRKKWKF